MKKIRVLLADDHLVVRMGLAAIMGREKDIAIVGEAVNGLEAVEKAAALRPDVIVMDMMMPELDGAEATKRILAGAEPVPAVLVLTTFGSSAGVRKALDAGAAGALVKDSGHEAIIEAVRTVAGGGRVVSDEIAAGIGERKPAAALSDRQREILGYVAKGFTTVEIARRLDVGADCVKAHLKTVFSRLGVSTRAEAVACALDQGLL